MSFHILRTKLPRAMNSLRQQVQSNQLSWSLQIAFLSTSRVQANTHIPMPSFSFTKSRPPQNGTRRHSQRMPENEDIARLVPNTKLVDVVDTNGRVQREKPLAETLAQLPDGFRLVAISTRPSGRDQKDPTVLCKIQRKVSGNRGRSVNLDSDKTIMKMFEITRPSTVENASPVSPQESQIPEEPEEPEVFDKEAIRKENKRRAMEKAEEKAKMKAAREAKKQKKTGASGKTKSLNVSWSIGPKDFHLQKKAIIDSMFKKGHTVQISLGLTSSGRVDYSSTAKNQEKRTTLLSTCREICEELGGKEKSMEGTLDSTVVILTFAPPSNK